MSPAAATALKGMESSSLKAFPITSTNSYDHPLSAMSYTTNPIASTITSTPMRHSFGPLPLPPGVPEDEEEDLNKIEALPASPPTIQESEPLTEDADLLCGGVECSSTMSSQAMRSWAAETSLGTSCTVDDDGGLWTNVDTRENTPLARSPGEGLLLHQKLSSPSRKKPLELSLKLAEEKQRNAERTRERLQSERALRLRASNTVKVEEVRGRRRGKLTQADIEQRLQRANDLRESVIEQRRRKAQEEEQKVNEVAFIQKLDTLNKKMEVLERQQDRDLSNSQRLSLMEEERRRKAEEKAAHDSAVLQRRMELECQRQARFNEIELRRRVGFFS